MRLSAIALLAAALGTSALRQPADPPLLLESGGHYTAPFSTGERLRFEIRWKPPLLPSIHAGDLSVSLEDGEMDGTATWRIEARATSAPGLARIISVDNYYESHIDRADFSSLRMVMKTRQGERHRDLLLEADYAARRLKVRETDPTSDPPRQIRNRSVRNLPGLLSDILSVFYAVRAREMEPGLSYLVLLNDRGRIRRVPISVEKYEPAETPLGTYPAIRLRTVGGLLGNGRDFTIWYSRDTERLPLSFEADAKVGYVSGKLIHLRTPHRIRSLVPVQ